MLSSLDPIGDGIDVAQLVDEIRTAVASVDDADVDLLRDVAAQYGEVCDSANRRLVECHSLLRRGLRSEAIQACEQEPKVLDLIELLDFPERGQWCGLLQQWSMAQPPLLKIDLAADLNEAYAEEESLSSLLRKHRLLALAHASLGARIAVLRSIRRRDPTNPAWEQDVANYERARLKQIPGELAIAKESRDAQQAISLYQELGSDTWTIQPDQELVQRCVNLHSQLQARIARDKLVTTEQQLGDAYSDFDVDAARAAKDVWDSHLPTADLASDDPLIERAQPALDWLDEQEHLLAEQTHFDSACRKFEADLDRNASLEILELQYHAIVRMERDIPNVLAHRYNQRLQAKQLSTKRRFRIAMAVAIGVLVITAASVVMFIAKRQHDDRILAATTSLAQLIRDDNFDGAYQAFEQLSSQDPAIAAEPELLALKSQVDVARSEESARRVAFTRALASALQAGIDDPDLAAVERTRKLARTNSEKSNVQEFESKIERRRSEVQRDRDEQFLTAFQEVQALLKQADSEDDVEETARRRLIEKTKSNLDMVLANHRLASASLRDQTAAVYRRLAAIETELDLRRSQRESLSALRQSIGDVKEYKDAAQSYIKKHPESVFADDLKRIVQESSLWDGIALWSDFLSSSEFRDLRTIEPAAAKELITQGDALIAQHGGIPLANEYTRRLPLLKAITARVDDKGDAIWESLNRLQQDSLISGIWMVQTSVGKRYYLQEKPDLSRLDNAKRAPIEYISGPDYSIKRSSIKVPDIIFNDWSPQTTLMKNIVVQLSKLKQASWELTFWNIVQQVHGDEHLDPILKYLLLERSLTIATKGSVLMQAAFGPYLKELQNASIDLSVNWLSPDNKDAETLRRQINLLLKRMPQAEDVRTVVQQQFLAILSSPQPRLLWSGILIRNDDSTWSCLFRGDSPTNSNLFVVTPDAATGNAVLAQIAQLRNGMVAWNNPFDERGREQACELKQIWSYVRTAMHHEADRA